MPSCVFFLSVLSHPVAKHPPSKQLIAAVTVACPVIPASGRLVDVYIPELSESPWPGSDIF